MKYKIEIEGDSIVDVGQLLYVFDDGFSLDYNEYIVNEINFSNKWVIGQPIFEYKINEKMYLYSNQFYYNLESEGGGENFINYFYTKDGADRQKEFRLSKYKERLENEIKEFENKILENKSKLEICTK